MANVTPLAPVITKKGSKQVWVKGIVWHPRKASCRIPVNVLVGTGAGGGRYASAAFVKSIEDSARGGQPLLSSRGKGWLRAASPRGRKQPPMEISGSCEIPVVFNPEDKVRNVAVRVVEGLPYGFIVGAAFLRKHQSVISFAEETGFKPSPDSPWVPFLSFGRQNRRKDKKAVGWHVATKAVRDHVSLKHMRKKKDKVVPVKIWDQFCTVRPNQEEEVPDGVAPPSRIPSIEDVAWEDDGAL